ncbi:Arginine/ornithine antiporter ArcD [Fulvivirga imtechensis AK7]|uniref:Arginine/ornithine antiporter ArcD n=1 Tax=Fulvivirga imtechensis AK7 TaxID=1237149 RepID=L8JIT9_9BACT|nr:TIGR00366 family protein [Fulvivirga imtechensis]ELR68776.1 Arginine/ornithine antiporter ArcD [Fulvivirga imtechensis AK7]
MKFKLPDTLILLLIILAAFTLLTWIIPAGEFDRQIVDERELVTPGSYHETESNPAGFFDFILAPIKGFISSAQIIVFIFFVAGSFGIINKTGAIEAGLQSVVRLSRQRPKSKKFVIPVLMMLFSLAGATFGMSEEVLVFILITLPLSFALGYDSIVGVSIPFIGAGAGFAGAFLNPFTIGIAQGIAELPPFSGWEYRLVVWALFTITAIVFVLIYANRIEKTPSASPMHEIDKKSRYKDHEGVEATFNLKHKAVVSIFLSGLVLLIVGVNQWDWYINEISGLFLILGAISALVYRMPVSDAVEAFVQGAAEMIKVTFVIAIAKGILIVASEGMIIDTILQALSTAVKDYPKAVSVELMFYMQSFLNFFLPSGSGQAALTMPIMAPLSDILGISRQTAVLAFQLGDGLSNIIIPTSGVTMGVLTIANIPYQKWFKWVLPLMIIFFLLAMLVLLPPVLFFDWSGM